MRSSLYTHLLGLFLLMIGALAATSVLTFVHTRAVAQASNDIVTDLIAVTNLNSAVDGGLKWLSTLATTLPSDRTDQEFLAIQSKVHQLRISLPVTATSPRTARMMQDLSAMADSFVVEVGAALIAHRSGDIDGYFTHDREAALIAGNILETTERIQAEELALYGQVYPAVVAKAERAGSLGLINLGLLIIVGILFAWSATRRLADPLSELANAADRIARGDLDGPAVPLRASFREARRLAEAFNQMQSGLRQSVRVLADKAELELRLLQSQINPHFLFNTLNMITRTALLEGAERTRGLMETTADLLRYGLRQSDRPVTLGEEIAQVERYMAIHQERFRDRLRFEQVVDPSLLGVQIPALTLQPLIENSLIHGIGPREEGGLIRLTVQREMSWIEVTVEDDGEGIPPDRLALLKAAALTEGGGGHLTGLGLGSVRRRLEVFWGERASLSVASQPGEGTQVWITLPLEEVSPDATAVG